MQKLSYFEREHGEYHRERLQQQIDIIGPIHRTQNVLQHKGKWLDQEMVKTQGRRTGAQTSNGSRPKGINEITLIQGPESWRTEAQTSNDSWLKGHGLDYTNPRTRKPENRDSNQQMITDLRAWMGLHNTRDPGIRGPRPKIAMTSDLVYQR